ncbi:MAG: hypothetical protein JKX85_03770, partial [Phycisphaeraceae bacterium]|nr:hypothetical protein [Phycisphaeraceae bacterium]
MNQPTLPTSDNPVAPPLEPHSNWPFIMRLLGGALGVVVLVYVVWWGFLYTMQDKMLFPTHQLPSPQLQPKFPNTVVMR